MKPPRTLSRAERVEWSRHVEFVRRLKLESSVDAGQFEAMIRHFCRARAADKALKVINGDMYSARLATMSRECWKFYAQLADKFGLSSTARAKLGAGKAEPEKAGDVPTELSDAGGGGA